MFLAGLFVATSVRRYGMAGFLRRRLVELLWVYLVGELINTTASVVLASVTNGEATWLDVVRLWAPTAPCGSCPAWPWARSWWRRPGGGRRTGPAQASATPLWQRSSSC